jgi:dextranase
VIQQFIDGAHVHGMAAMPYLAVYAASAQFWRAHPDWALYDSDHKPIPFGQDFLGLMNPTPGGRWARHLLDACGRLLATLPFDGLHVDQYGDPKVAFDAQGQSVDLPAAFANFICSLKAAHPHAAVLFNAVGNWPIEALTASPQDFAYIEVWPPATTYRDLQQIVTQARVLSGGKPVVIALYLPADQPTNIRLADALILSCGGSRIELGEQERLLADPYFPKHQALSSELQTTLRRYCDFVVRYGDLIGPAAGDTLEYSVQAPSGVQAIARTSPGWLTVALVNMTGLGEAHWDEAQSEPTPLTEVSLQIVSGDGAIRQVWWASPDHDQPQLISTTWTANTKGVHATLPYLDYWAILALELDEGSSA